MPRNVMKKLNVFRNRNVYKDFYKREVKSFSTLIRSILLCFRYFINSLLNDFNSNVNLFTVTLSSVQKHLPRYS